MATILFSLLVSMGLAANQLSFFAGHLRLALLRNAFRHLLGGFLEAIAVGCGRNGKNVIFSRTNRATGQPSMLNPWNSEELKHRTGEY